MNAPIRFALGCSFDFDRNGVAFYATHNGEEILCLVSEEALQEHFGADGGAQAFIDAFEFHRIEIERVAEKRIRNGDQEPIMLVSRDF
ncbi:DUF1488 domain-containing protein [Chitinolyticbacter meiyuanensis]|uniref:DUF1488 domain-containing protein n=1 Tax=Chitinolyticbacter meiyuanensis TaxID=682798 RepID=UPI001652A44B|nr:DUF1488 domain-containing protein [Chitinolyticbacter meiyuanensis]